MPPVVYKFFEVLQGQSGAKRPPAYAGGSDMRVTASSLENARYKVKIDANGDLASIFDKEADRELLRSPIRLELRDDPSPDKPAWRILWDTVNSAPREYVSGPEICVVDLGSVTGTLELS